MATLAEAKTKWCPLARQIVTIDRSLSGSPIAVANGNRFQNEQMALCIGSACMAWRWKDSWAELPRSKWPVTDDRQPEGYCGAFGKP